MQSQTEQESAPSSSFKTKKLDFTSLLDIIIGAVIFFAGWQAVFWLHLYPSFLFPSPLMVLERLIFLAKSPNPKFNLGASTLITMERLAAGFTISVGLGTGVGMVMVHFRRFGRTMNSFCVGLQSYPSIAWVPFAILIVGLNNYGIVFVVVISSVFSMMVSTYSSLRNIPPIYVKAARNMGEGGVSLFKNVMLPASFPSLITGIRQTWSFAWHALIGAEILMATIGLGALLELGADFAEMNQIIAAMVIIFIIGFAVDRVLFSMVEDRVRTKRGLNQIPT